MGFYKKGRDGPGGGFLKKLRKISWKKHTFFIFGAIYKNGKKRYFFRFWWKNRPTSQPMEI